MISLFFYLVLAAGSSVAMHFAQKLDRKVLLLVPIVLLTLTAGLRGPEVGVDTAKYIYIFDRGFSQDLSFINQDQLFYLAGVGLMHICPFPQVPLFVTALATYVLMFLRMWDFRYSAGLGVMTWVYVLYYWGGTMNAFRQMLAVAIVFYASRSLVRRKYWFYLIGVVLAALIHLSAVVALAIPVVYILFKRNFRPPEYVYLGVCGAAVIPAGILFVLKYAKYLDDLAVNFGLMPVVRIALAVIGYLLFRRSVAQPECPAGSKADDSSFHLVFTISAVGLAMGFASMFVEFASRTGYYFRVFEIVLFGMIFYQFHRNDEKRIPKAAVLGAVSLVGIYYLWRYNGIIPYQTVFGVGLG